MKAPFRFRRYLRQRPQDRPTHGDIPFDHQPQRNAPVTYEEAREIARRAVEPNWNQGTFCLDDRIISETDLIYVFKIGAREHLVGGDKAYMRYGGPVAVVHKADGRLEWIAEVVIGPDPNIRDYPNPNPTLVV